MKWNAYLLFDGQCEAAFKYYEKCLGGTIAYMMTYGDSRMEQHAPPDWHKKIAHATFTRGDQVISGADVAPEKYQKPQGFSMMLGLSDAAEADRIFQALAENGAVQMPLQETFWALRFGVVTDQFGTPWMINCEKSA